MKRIASFVLGLSLICFVVGCGESEGDGHKSDTTPGGEQGTPADELMSDEAFDDYGKTQGGLKKDGKDPYKNKKK